MTAAGALTSGSVPGSRLREPRSPSARSWRTVATTRGSQPRPAPTVGLARGCKTIFSCRWGCQSTRATARRRANANGAMVWSDRACCTLGVHVRVHGWIRQGCKNPERSLHHWRTVERTHTNLAKLGPRAGGLPNQTRYRAALSFLLPSAQTSRADALQTMATFCHYIFFIPGQGVGCGLDEQPSWHDGDLRVRCVRTGPPDG
jgi:hypothetical protein